MFIWFKKIFFKNPPKVQSFKEGASIECTSTTENDELYCLEQLSHSDHTYWKFCQSEKGRSEECHFAEYEVGKITIAKDIDKQLSFVEDNNVAMCYMYGDILVKLSFDGSNPLFNEIKDCPVRYIGCGLGEYETEKLLPEKLYPLNRVESIRKIFELTTQKRDLFAIFCGNTHNLSYYLNSYGFFETYRLLECLTQEFEKIVWLEFEVIKETLLKMIDEFE